MPHKAIFCFVFAVSDTVMLEIQGFLLIGCGQVLNLNGLEVLP